MRKLLSVYLLAIAGVVQAQAHSVTLTWVASPSASSTVTVTYNVYRGTGACPQNSGLVKLTATPLTALTFTDTDTALTAGQSYCYQVTGVANGSESGAAVQAQAQIPSTITVTQPPTGAAVTDVH